MKTADIYNWRVTWQPHPDVAAHTVKVSATSKFGAKKIARLKFDIPASCIVKVVKLGIANA